MSLIVIIGGGISGLAAAFKLREAGHSVVVLEANSHPGGRMWTIPWHGFDVETGASFVTTNDEFLLHMVREVGLESTMLKPRKGLDITTLRDGKLYSANFLNLFSLMRWGGVSVKARLSMFKLLPYMLNTVMKLKGDIYHLERIIGEGDETSFRQFFHDKISPELFEKCFYPMFEVMCAYKQEDVSQQAFLGLMAGYNGADTMTFSGGLGVLPRRLAEVLDVQLNSPVKRIDFYPDKSGAKITYIQDGVEKVIACDAVIIATQGDAVSKLFTDSGMPPTWQEFYRHVKYSSGALHYFLVDSEFDPGSRVIFLPHYLGLPINNISFLDRRDGKLLLMTDPNVYSDWASQPDNVVARRSVQTVENIFPQLRGKTLDNILFRWNSKLPTFPPGYLTALAKFWQNPQEGPAFVCGDYLAGPSTGGALFTGLEAAERVMKYLS